jgi:hypothetical protein
MAEPEAFPITASRAATEKRERRSREEKRGRELLTMRFPVLILASLLASSCPSQSSSVSASHLRPRFHPLGGTPDGKGDVTGAIKINSTWSVWAVGEPWRLTQSQDLVHWETVPSDIGFAGTTGAIALSEAGVPYAIHPCGPGYCAAIAKDTTLRNWSSFCTLSSSAFDAC